jgi:type II secretory pathway pseudopilin PulG
MPDRVESRFRGTTTGIEDADIYGEFMSSPKTAQLSKPVRRRSIAGFSLVEVMIAAAVLVVGCTAVFAALTRVQRNAIVNRAHTNAYNILRNVMDQAMQRGWDTLESTATPQLPSADPRLKAESDKPGPKDHLKPTIAGTNLAYVPNPGEPGSLVARNATVASDPNWKLWSMYNAEDDRSIYEPGVTPGVAPIYQDYQNPTRDIPARIYRKVQYVQNDRSLLWITFRIEYTIRGQNYAHNMCGLRAID